VRAEIIAVGSELVHFGMRDANSEWLCRRLLDIGIRAAVRTDVEDDDKLIANTVALAVKRSAVVLISGGLGPTEDDRTRGAVARGVGVALERDETVVAELERRFAERGRRFTPEQARQAYRPRGAEWLLNPLGTAPGFALDLGGVLLFALPGVPGELKSIFESAVEPRLRERVGEHASASRVFRIGGKIEPAVDTAIRDLYDDPNVTFTVLARSTGMEVLVTVEAKNAAEARRRLDAIDAAIVSRLGDALIGRGDRTLARAVGEMLVASGLTLATAESCTAGLLAGELTEVPGSSAWFRGGVVVYANDLKTELAGVDAAVIEAHGAVSAEVARMLAEGARERCRADLGIGVTGVAGPGGGTPDKPVGRVHVALADAGETVDRRFDLIGDRRLIRKRAVIGALEMLRRRLL
jgi:nicotinamide-nucleotide amidase